MAKIKVKKKEVLDPEAAISLWTQTRDYVTANARQLGAIALVVCVIAAGITLWSISRARSERESLSLFYDALNTSEQKSEKATADEQASRVLDKFKNILQKYPGTKAGISSLLYAGNCSYKLKKYDDAITYYKDFLDKAGDSLRYLKSFAYEGMGYAYEGKGDYKGALQWFEKQKNEGQSEVNSTCLLNLARCYEAEGTREKACELYKEFIEKYPSSSLKDLALVKIGGVCGKQ